jgi:transposase-like protein
MKICPRCKKSTRFIHVIAKKRKKQWDIYRCSKCSYNLEIEEFTGDGTVKEELDKPGTIWDNRNYFV